MGVARKKLGISQAALAANCQRLGWDLSRDVLARIESGIRGVSDKELAIFSVVLNIPIQELLTHRISLGFVKMLKG